MTDEILKWTADQCCEWLFVHGVPFGDGCKGYSFVSSEDGYLYEQSGYNHAACAFAVRDYIANNLSNDEMRNYKESIEWFAHGMVPFWAPVIYWLRAAVKVLKGREKQ